MRRPVSLAVDTTLTQQHVLTGEDHILPTIHETRQIEAFPEHIEWILAANDDDVRDEHIEDLLAYLDLLYHELYFVESTHFRKQLKRQTTTILNRYLELMGVA